MKKLLLLFSLCLCSLTSFSQTTVQGHKDGFNCVVAVSTATGLTAACSAIAGNRPMYITDIEFGSSAAAATFSADTFPTLKYGTGSTCGTGTTVFWQAMIGATGQVTSNLVTPIKIPKGNDVCWIMSTAGSKTLQIHGFYGDTE
jgi:hypothetical protein